MTTIGDVLRPRVVAAARRHGPDTAVLAGLVVVSVVFTWPLMRHPATQISDLKDGFHLAWLLSWTAHTAVTRPWQIFDAPAFHPLENGLALSEHLIGGGLLGLPVWLVTHNAVLVFNVVVLLTFVLGAFGAYLLLKDVTGWRPAGLAAAVVFGFSTYRISRVGQVHVGLTMWFPYVLLALRRFVRRPHPRTALWLALALWAQAVSSLHGTQILVATLPVAAAVLIAQQRSRLREPEFWAASTIAASALVLISLPVLVPYFDLYQANSQFRRAAAELALYSSGPLGLLTAPSVSRLWFPAFNALGQAHHYEKTLFPGVFTLLAAGAGFAAGVSRRSPRTERVWALVFGAVVLWSAAMSVGSDEDLGGLFGLARAIPGFDAFRVAGRFQTMTTLGLGGLAGIAVSSLRRTRGRRVRWTALAGAGCTVALLLADVAPRSLAPGQQAPPIPPVYGWLAAQPADTAVLELPTGERLDNGDIASWTFQREAVYLWYQTRHFRPILNGYSSNQPLSYQQMVDSVADFPSIPSLDYLRSVGTSYVILHRETLADTRWRDAEAAVRARAPAAIVIDDGNEVVLDVGTLAVIWAQPPPTPSPRPRATRSRR